jgi:hypothetical protein
MQANLENFYERTLDWYVQLAAHPGWKGYVWHRVNELAREHPALFADLPDQLTARMPPKSSGDPPSSGV